MTLQAEHADGEVLLIASERFASHAPPPGHPERIERAEIMSAVAMAWADGGGQVAEPIKASTDALLKVHASEYIESVVSTSGRSVRLDPDTYTSPDSEEVARYAAHARSRRLARVAVVDYDVHHGNGTQWSFYNDPTVLFISLHQYPFYPGTGAADDVGSGDGAGFTDADYALVFDRVVLPVLESYGPEMVLLSAGFDAHARDPLGGMHVSTAGYAEMTSQLCAFADRRCAGRLVGVTEGGYDLRALEECLESTLRVLAGQPADSPSPGNGPTVRADAALKVVGPAQAAFWPGL